MLPDSLRKYIEDKLGRAILATHRASGGSINQAAAVEVAQTGRCFLKWNSSADPDMFEKEAAGLHLLRKAGTGLIVPDAIDRGSAGDTGYLLLEYIEQGQAVSGSAEQFGRDLAELHRGVEERFGLDHDNFIGKLPQSNSWHGNWTEFFVEERMEPQLRMAVNGGRLASGIRSSFEKLYRKLDGIFPEEPPSLLHGDLWGGNYFYNADGAAVIYDPAVYYGNREIELAFTHMFGGFSSGFYKAYNEAWPLQPGFEGRKNIYNLYPLLVHTNLFGGHYGSQVASIVRGFG